MTEEEKIVLDVLVDNSKFQAAAATVWHEERPARIFQSMGQLVNQGKPIDLVTLAEHLEVTGGLSEVPVDYIVGLLGQAEGMDVLNIARTLEAKLEAMTARGDS